MLFVFLADGFEELEAFAPIDILRRAKKEVLTVGVTGKTVAGSHGIPVICDKTIPEIDFGDDTEALILPGGMPGTVNLEKCEELQNLIDKADEAKILICAICAAPSILGHKGILFGKSATCYTGFEKDLTGANVLSVPVVRDQNIITAYGAGAAFQFGFEILSALCGNDISENIRKSMRFGE